MTTTRLEAFSDAVIAIAITIMVLELKVPHGSDWNALRPLTPVLLTYALSFVILGIYWSNHHHLMHATDRVNGKILWANLHLLFWLSLVPFLTAWMGESHIAALPTALYGVVLLLAAVSYRLLVGAILEHHGRSSKLGAAIGRDVKGWLSIALYVTAVPMAIWNSWIAVAIYVFVALVWLVPDRRIERQVAP